MTTTPTAVMTMFLFFMEGRASVLSDDRYLRHCADFECTVAGVLEQDFENVVPFFVHLDWCDQRLIIIVGFGSRNPETSLILDRLLIDRDFLIPLLTSRPGGDFLRQFDGDIEHRE